MLTILITCSLLQFEPISAQAAGRPDSPAVVDPQAIQVLGRMIKELNELDKYWFGVTTTWVVRQQSGLDLHFSANSEVYVDRPGLLRVHRQSEDGTKSGLRIKGGEAMIFVDEHYNKLNVPSSMDEALDAVLDRYDITAPLVDFVYSNGDKTFMDGIRGAVYVGHVKVHTSSQFSHHIAIRKDHVDYQLWINAQGPAFPEKFVVTWTDQPGQPWLEARFVQFEAKVSDRKLNLEDERVYRLKEGPLPLRTGQAPAGSDQAGGKQ